MNRTWCAPPQRLIAVVPTPPMLLPSKTRPSKIRYWMFRLARLTTPGVSVACRMTVSPGYAAIVTATVHDSPIGISLCIAVDPFRVRPAPQVEPIPRAKTRESGANGPLGRPDILRHDAVATSFPSGRDVVRGRGGRGGNRQAGYQHGQGDDGSAREPTDRRSSAVPAIKRIEMCHGAGSSPLGAPSTK